MNDLIAAGLVAGRRVVLLTLLPLTLSACGSGSSPSNEMAGMESMGQGGERAANAGGLIKMSPQQITAAGIELARPIVGESSGAIEAAAILESDPDGTRVVAAPLRASISCHRRSIPRRGSYR